MLEPIFREFKKQKYEVYIFWKALNINPVKTFFIFFYSQFRVYAIVF